MSNINRLDTWIEIIEDPHAKMRGFSLKGRQFKVEGHDTVQGEMEDFFGKKMSGIFWVVTEDEMFRVVPELIRYAKGKPWFIPHEFTNRMYRPYYFRRSKSVDVYLPSPEEKEKKIEILRG